MMLFRDLKLLRPQIFHQQLLPLYSSLLGIGVTNRHLACSRHPGGEEEKRGQRDRDLRTRSRARARARAQIRDNVCTRRDGKGPVNGEADGIRKVKSSQIRA